MVIPKSGMRDGTIKVGLDHCWIGFGVFWLVQTRNRLSDPTRSWSTRLATREKTGLFERHGWILGECSDVPESQEDA
ncbi:hypothetical protein CDL15_Pgr027300 [Punica granatum]|uniref:Uncharacterized protein n=1 Tax=Punica granatum TaxID=22663 RepID=A0A218XSQ9_PUNGR|nr:hypothetical protein CDL15_Pgr027300 [Punica granatum]PKI71840.1 hypothetical protein CRG98_007779 [Punica granatum]